MEKSPQYVFADNASCQEKKRFGLLFAKHADALRRFLLTRGVRPDDVDDLIQQIFEVVWNKCDTIVSGKEKSFLYSTAIRTRDAHRKNARRRGDLDKAFAALSQVSRSTARPADEAAISKEQERMIRERLDELPPRIQQAVRQVYLNEHSVADTAGTMGITPKTVYELLARGMKRLKNLLGKEMD